MSIVFECPFCARHYQVDPKYAGRRIACKQCARAIRVPGQISEASLAGIKLAAEQEKIAAAKAAFPTVPTIQTSCPYCERPHKVDAKYGGKKIKCKKCGEVFRVPMEGGVGAKSSVSDADRDAALRADVALVEEARRKREEAQAHERARIEAEAAEAAEAARIARENEDRQARLIAEQKARVEAEHAAREEAERLARLEAQRLAHEAAERKEREDAEAAAHAQAERQAELAAEAARKAEAERLAKQEADRLEAQRLAILEVERLAREAAERKARAEAEAAAQVEAKRQADLAAEAARKAEAEQLAKQEAARIEAQRLAKLEAERLAREAAAHKAREEAEAAARAAAKRQADLAAEAARKAETDRLAKLEAERLARVEASRVEAARLANLEVERLAKQEAERLAREESQRKARAEAEKSARAEAARLAQIEAERIAREEAEKQARIAAAQAEAERRAKLEAERSSREAAEKAAQVQAERQQRLAAQLAKEAEAKRAAQTEKERLAKIEADRIAEEETERQAKVAAAQAEAARVEAEKNTREEAERQAKLFAEEAAKAEVERIASFEAERLSREAVEPAPSPAPPDAALLAETPTPAESIEEDDSPAAEPIEADIADELEQLSAQATQTPTASPPAPTKPKSPAQPASTGFWSKLRRVWKKQDATPAKSSAPTIANGKPSPAPAASPSPAPLVSAEKAAVIAPPASPAPAVSASQKAPQKSPAPSMMAPVITPIVRSVAPKSVNIQPPVMAQVFNWNLPPSTPPATPKQPPQSAPPPPTPPAEPPKPATPPDSALGGDLDFSDDAPDAVADDQIPMAIFSEDQTQTDSPPIDPPPANDAASITEVFEHTAPSTLNIDAPPTEESRSGSEVDSNENEVAETTAASPSQPAPRITVEPDEPLEPVTGRTQTRLDVPAIRLHSPEVEEEKSPGGSPIYRHKPRDSTVPIAPPLTPYLSHITQHIEKNIGRSPIIFHEILSIGVHIDLHVIPPTDDPPSGAHPRGSAHFTVVTSGLSTRPMNLPPGCNYPAHAELMICLPVDWPGMNLDGTFDTAMMRDERNWWPMRWLKAMARMPFEYNTFIGPGHTIPNGPAAEPFAENTALGCMLVQPSLLNPRASRLVVSDNVTIQFYALWPIYREEMQLKQTRGIDALIERFRMSGTSELIQLDRKNVCGR